MKKLIAGAVVIGALAMAAPAFAASGGFDYGDVPGQGQASACGSAHGSFSYFDGETNLGVNSLGPGTPEYHGGAKGQEPGATGYNNSHTNCNA